jgi:hypothetical protein
MLTSEDGATQIQYRDTVNTTVEKTYKVQMASGIKNFARGLIKVLGLQEKRFDVSLIEKNCKSIENFYERMFTAITGNDKKCSIEVTDIGEEIEGDFSATINVTLCSSTTEKDLSKFKIFMKKERGSGHTEVNSCQTFIKNY